jgi:hypothetical protein
MSEKFQILNDGEHCDVYGSPDIARAVSLGGCGVSVNMGGRLCINTIQTFGEETF